MKATENHCIDYNTDRPKLRMYEHGRHIQDLVDHCLTIEDRARRQKCAEGIVEKLSLMHAADKKQPGFKEKMWDQLAIMSNFELDIDYPYDISAARNISTPPEPVPYNKNRIPGRHYGNLVFKMLEHLRDMQPGNEQDKLIQLVGSQMKRDIIRFGNSQPDNERIISDIAYFTDGKVQVDPDRVKFGYIKMTEKDDEPVKHNNQRRQRKRRK